jgi:hypothetical protein
MTGISHGSVLIGFLIFISILAVKPSFGGERSLKPSAPPLLYRINEASIRLVLYPGRSASPPRSAVLSGGGSATREQDGKSVDFPYPVTDFLAFLNELYKIRFFELPRDYTIRYSVFLQDGRTVRTSALRMADELVPVSASMCLDMKNV